ncbi:glycosyltransferase [Gorillibacterium sp. sgz500922]|uniref:glycosyltransferase n=1 Tax=Gorillibacterium sp. sgz500922 TaxID=3446694 RepID=UPI003F670EC8
MRAAILTMFNGLAKTYSLVQVVEEQLHMLTSAGIPVRLLVSQDCPDSERYGIFLDERVEWVKINNRLDDRQIHWKDYSQASGRVHASFFREAEAIAADLAEQLAPCDVCLLHDIHYQGWHLVHNVALRLAQASLPELRFFAFTHSAPAEPAPLAHWPFSARYTPMPRTTYVYPTESGLAALAAQYRVPLSQCRAVNNTLDVFAGLGEAAKQLGEAVDFSEPEFLLVYPGRLTPGKRLEKVAGFAGALRKASGGDVRVIFCDFPSLDVSPAAYKNRIRAEGRERGGRDEDYVFTSDCGWPHGFPHQGVMDLFTLSNLYVCPSYSESFGLTVLEAASRGNHLILNQAVPALQELGRELGAAFMRWDARNFGFDTRETYQPSEQAYLDGHAAEAVRAVRGNPALSAKTVCRRRYGRRWIWEHQLKPLLMEEG